MNFRILRALAARALLALIFGAAASHPIVMAQEQPTPLSDEVAARFDGTLEQVDQGIATIERLSPRLAQAEGLRRPVLEARIQREWVTALDRMLNLADEAANLRDKGFDVSPYTERLQRALRELPVEIWSSMQRVISEMQFPDSALPAADQADIDQRFFASSVLIEDSLRQLARAIDISRRYDINVDAEEEKLRAYVGDLVDSVSILLDMSLDEASRLKSAAAALPEDTELAGRQRVADARVRSIVARFEVYVALADKLGIRTAPYRQQILGVTGKISTETLNAEVIGGFFDAWGESVSQDIKERGPAFVFSAIMFIVVVYLFYRLAIFTETLVDKALRSERFETSRLLRRMLTSVSRNVVIVVGVLIALAQLGVSLGPVLTGLGIAGFIVGFALQDSLSNFASGMLILIYRPFDVGDTVEVAGIFGKVDKMSLVNTTILTLDNQTLIIPNNKIWQDIIKNLTDQHLRRVDMVFGVSYATDLDRAERVLYEVMKADDRVLDYPELNIRVHELAESSVNFIVRPWVKTEDYWDLYWDTMKRVKQRFDEEGIGIPFPQRDVHLYPAGDAASVPPPEVARFSGAPSDTRYQGSDPIAEEEDG